jgi:hypothetical protein
MPSLGALFEWLIRVVGDVLNASSLRIGVVPTLALLGVLLVLLQLAARPAGGWQSRDPAGLAGVTRWMALAAEAGTAAAVSLGSAGLARAGSAAARIQTLAALPILMHVARAAARAGVPLEVSVNDPLAAVAADATLAAAHERTATEERSGRSRVTFVGEGRPAAAGMALARPHRADATFLAGGLGEEGLLLARGLGGDEPVRSAGTADAEQAASVLVAADAALIGPELFGAAADLRALAEERTGAIAANRLLLLAVVVLLLGTLLTLFGVVDARSLLLEAA